MRKDCLSRHPNKDSWNFEQNSSKKILLSNQFHNQNWKNKRKKYIACKTYRERGCGPYSHCHQMIAQFLTPQKSEASWSQYRKSQPIDHGDVA